VAHWAVLGLDAGGSKTKGLRVVDGRIVREALTGSANIGYVGVEAAMHQVDLLLDQLDRENVAAACIGAAGADTPKARERWQELLQGRLPRARIRVVHDSRLILAAAGLDQGISLISGTGSIAWGIGPEGVEARAGGWGYLLGDEGSGYWVTYAAVRHALAALDRGSPPDRLTEQLVTCCGLEQADELLGAFYASPTAANGPTVPGSCSGSPMRAMGRAGRSSTRLPKRSPTWRWWWLGEWASRVPW